MHDLDFTLLLSKRLSGDISAEEAILLDAWMRDSEENAQLAAQYQQIWESSQPRSKVFELDMEAEFRQLQARIKQGERLPARRVSLRQTLLRVAAAVVFLLGAFWGFQQLAGPAPQSVVEYAATGETRLVTLPDGSRVWLRPNARLVLPERFTGATREVQLSGEAYFDVARDENRPFRINLDQGGLVEVLGTEFNVNASAGADQTSVLVREGKVRYAPEKEHAGAMLVAGDKAVFHRQKRQLQLSRVATFNELAWQTGGLEFIRTPLRQVIRDLETHYNVKIDLRNTTLQECLYTAPLTNQPIETVLESLALTFRMKLSGKSSGQYVLAGGVCQ